MKDISFTQNRELSWLDFNRRVIAEARDKTVPLLERLKFVSIWDSNLEEFFMVRIGSLTDLSDLKKKAVDNKSNMTPKEQIKRSLSKLRPMYEEKDAIYFDLLEDLRKNGLYIEKVSKLDNRGKENSRLYFYRKVEPILSFQVIDRVHPLPRLANLTMAVVFELKDKDGKDLLGLAYIPARLKRYVRISESKYVFLEDIIKEFAGEVFEGYEVGLSYVMSLTRNTDISFDDDDYDVDEDFRAYMKKKLRKRKKLQPVRLEVDSEISKADYDFYKRHFGLEKESIFITKSPMQLSFVYDMVDSLAEDFKKDNSFKEFSPQPSAMVDKDRPMIDQVLERDIILSYPYESMDPMIRLLDEAADDPSVESIKISLYRIAKDSKIAKALMKASENGKEVIVLMELKARFDENNNILWSSRLEEAGCKLVYGFEGYKCHCKVLHITRLSKNGAISYISQIATGNYNEKTAKQYTDFSFMTSDFAIGEDCKDLFDNILIGKLDGEYKNLMVSPKSMQDGLKKLIEEEIDKANNNDPDAYIRLKMNSISDRGMIDLLSKASKAGVKIDMMVRGITCILPGIEGKTENISIYQIVGRFLEHHRVYQFGKNNPKVYISSADFMTRNIRNRVEVACPIKDKNIKDYILKFLDIMFTDDVKIRKLLKDGTYIKLENKNNIIAQEELMKKASLMAYQKKDGENFIGQSNNHKILRSKANKRLGKKTGLKGFLRNIFKESSK